MVVYCSVFPLRWGGIFFFYLGSFSREREKGEGKRKKGGKQGGKGGEIFSSHLGSFSRERERRGRKRKKEGKGREKGERMKRKKRKWDKLGKLGKEFNLLSGTGKHFHDCGK